MEITTEYTGSYPCLCSGEWLITIDNQLIKSMDSDSKYLLQSPMNTEGTYQSWYFGNDYDAIWKDYTAGVPFLEWLDTEVGRKLINLISLHGIEPVI